MSRLKKRHERGHVVDLYIKLHGGVAPRLADEWLGDIKLRDITKKMCEDFIEDRIAEGLAPRAAKNYAQVLGTVLTRAVNEGLLIKNPMTGAEMPVCDPPVHILTPDELGKLLSTASQISRSLTL